LGWFWYDAPPEFQPVAASPATEFGAVLGKRSSGGAIFEGNILMQADIHPKYEEVTATCSCGNIIKTRSTLCQDLHIDVCSACHPFYTGKQKMLDTGGRVDRFKKRFGSRGAKK
jgi:large subunit ribosomal protein L31